MYSRVSNYLESAFVPKAELVKNAHTVLKGVDYDTMIGTGLSGALVVPLLARELGKHFAIVRKPDDSPHCQYSIEGVIGDRWIFVDDFISTGRTALRVEQEVKTAARGREEGFEWRSFSTTYVGCYMYHRKQFSPAQPEAVFSGCQESCCA